MAIRKQSLNDGIAALADAGSGWIVAGAVLTALGVTVAAMYAETVQYLLSIWGAWETGEYGHGYLVIAISAYLVYHQHRLLAREQPCPCYLALLPLALSASLWLVATLTDVQMIQAIALLGVLISLVWAMLGTHLIARLLFPLAFLVLAIPVWSLLSPLLQQVTADSVFTLVRLLEIPALRAENYIVLPAGRLAIEEACSGLRFVLAATTLGALFAYLNYSTVVARLWVIAIAVGSAVLMNIVRVLVVVYLAYISDMQHPLVNDHLALGWYLFTGLVVTLLIVDFLLHRGRGAASEQTGSAVPERPRAGCRRFSGKHLAVLVLSLLVALTPPVIISRYNSAEARPGTAAFTFPVAGGGWSGPGIHPDDWSTLYHGAVSEKRIYTEGQGAVYLHIAYYPSQSQGKELINDWNAIADNKPWGTLYLKARPGRAGGEPVLEQMIASGAGERRLVYYWYDVAGRRTVNAYAAKSLQLLGLLRGQRQAAMIAVATPVAGGDVDTARAALERFLLTHPLSMETLVTTHTAR